MTPIMNSSNPVFQPNHLVILTAPAVHKPLPIFAEIQSPLPKAFKIKPDTRPTILVCIEFLIRSPFLNDDYVTAKLTVDTKKVELLTQLLGAAEGWPISIALL